MTLDLPVRFTGISDPVSYWGHIPTALDAWGTPL